MLAAPGAARRLGSFALSLSRHYSQGVAQADPHIKRLFKWLTSDDIQGFIHPHLTAGISPTLGCRGIIAEKPISKTTVYDQYLISVPAKCCIVDVTAAAALSEMISMRAIEDVKAMDIGVLESLALAWSRRNPKAMWAPYAASLPARPPNPWAAPKGRWLALAKAAGEQALDISYRVPLPSAPEEEVEGPSVPSVSPVLGSPGSVSAGRGPRQLTDDWLKIISKEYADQKQLSDDLAREHGKTLGITSEDIFWARAHVLSRSFVSQPSGKVTVLPVIDMCNHRAGAAQPSLGPSGVNSQNVVLGSRSRGKALALEAGDELFMSYFVDRSADPQHAFRDYGFVPELESWAPSAALSLLKKSIHLVHQ